MTEHLNISELKELRRKLRRDQTFYEKVMWMFIRDRKTLNTKFRRQYSIDHYVIDFYSPEIKLAIELDGTIHNSPENKKYDKARQEYLEAFGISFIRITNEELLGNPDKVFKKIEEKIYELRRKK